MPINSESDHSGLVYILNYRGSKSNALLCQSSLGCIIIMCQYTVNS